jgi:hypothetical protein
LTVGRSQAHGAPTYFWPGAVEEVRVYSIALDDVRVKGSTRIPGPRRRCRRSRPSLTSKVAAHPPENASGISSGGVPMTIAIS